MRSFWKALSAIVVGAGLLALPAVARAQELTLRLEPGVAIPLGSPQANRFFVGGAVAVKPELTLGHYVGIGPSVSVEALPSQISGIDTGAAWGFGGFVRVKRPHDALNKGTGFGAVSPWADADLQYIRTGPLDRLGFAVAVGAQVPTSASRWLWVGPFVRLQDVNQDGGHPGFDTTNSKTLIAGLSFEFGAKAVTAPAPVPVPAPPPPVVIAKKVTPPPPVVTHQEIKVEYQETIQFAWDSPVLDATASAQVAEVSRQLKAAKDFGHVTVEGHASSEGQVEHNNVLAQARAQSVVDGLVVSGIPASKLTAKGFGSRVPVATNSTEAGRVLNRRVNFDVKFVIVKESN